MKRKVVILLTALFIFFSNFAQNINQYGAPKKIIVAGKIDNFDPNKEVILAVNRIGFSQEKVQVKADSVGNFKTTFESYIPLDAWIRYNNYQANFLVMLHPGDSLFVHFDGKRQRSGNKMFNTILFSGDAAKTNQYASKFQQMYYSMYGESPKKFKAIQKYNTDQYIEYLDNKLQKSQKIFNKFVTKHQPDDESKKWAQLYIECDYYGKLGFVDIRRNVNNPGKNTEPKGISERLFNRLPIDTSMFISSYALSMFSNSFSFVYPYEKMYDILTNRETVISGNNRDSIRIFHIVEFTRDPLLRQIALTEIFSKELDFFRIENYKRFYDLVNTHIKEPFLKEPLHQKYIQIKPSIENPQTNPEAIIKEVADLSINQIMDEILQQNKDKAIYVDFWATWCGPCLAEFPNSIKLEHELKDKDVSFVYICLESEEKQYKAILDKFQLAGQHYLLSSKQSAEIRNHFGISGIPFYLLIDKKGVIMEKGSHLRPLYIKEKINNLNR